MIRNKKEYEIILASSAAKEILALSESVFKRMSKVINGLKNNPLPRGTLKLMGRGNLYRIRVGVYRIIYSIDDKHNIVDITYIRHRSKAYKK